VPGCPRAPVASPRRTAAAVFLLARRGGSRIELPRSMHSRRRDERTVRLAALLVLEAAAGFAGGRVDRHASSPSVSTGSAASPSPFAPASALVASRIASEFIGTRTPKAKPPDLLFDTLHSCRRRSTSPTSCSWSARAPHRTVARRLGANAAHDRDVQPSWTFSGRDHLPDALAGPLGNAHSTGSSTRPRTAIPIGHVGSASSSSLRRPA